MGQHKKIFEDLARWQSWLEVEAALAEVQADLKVIPEWAAAHITSKANINNFDKRKITAEIEKTGSPVFALVSIFADICGAAGNYLHLGATTQNIIETGRLINLKKYHKILLTACSEILKILKSLAIQHADTLMIGRTQLNHALPITFGFKLAGWINDFILLIDRITDTEKRLFLLRFGGAVGAFHSFGTKGLEISEALAQKLKMDISLVQGRSSPEGHLEYILNLCSLGQVVSKIGNELYFLHADGINELNEEQASETVGSSTMPHKVNAKRLIKLRSDSSLLVQKMAAVMLFTNPLNEGDASSNNELSEMFKSTCPCAIDLLYNLRSVFKCLKINSKNMEKNVRSTQYFTATEALQMELAAHVGKLKAHHIIHTLSLQSNQDPDGFLGLVEKEEEIQRHISKQKLKYILRAENNLGDSSRIANEAAQAASAKISDLNKKLNSDYC